MASEKTPRKIKLVFFRNDAGGEPVREWLQGLNPTERRAIGTDLLRAQWRWPVSMPLCRPMRKGLWEVRTDLPNNRTARVLICLCGGRSRSTARFHQRNPRHSRRRFAAGT